MIDISVKRYSVRLILISTALAFGYAILRYNIVGAVPWSAVPIFIFNKGISLASLFLLTLNYSLHPMKNFGVGIPIKLLKSRKSLGIIGFAYAFTHLILSLILLIPSYYPTFFINEDTLSVRGGLCLFGGVVGFVLLWLYYKSFKPNLNMENKIIERITSKKSIMYILFFIGIHLFFLGYTGWLNFDSWPGGLPPISLISFLIFCTGFLINLIGRK